MSRLSRLAVAGLAVALAAPSGAQAAERRPLSVEMRAGVEYDSNVAVEQADVVTSSGDMSLILGASAKYRFATIGKTEMTAGYDFDQTLYEDLTSYNLQMHAVSLGSATRIGKASLGADYRFFHMRLGGQAFLNMQMASPSISGFVGKDLFLRASYTYFRKEFTTADTLDANTHDVEANAYYFFLRKRGFLSVTARYENENTADPSLEYESLQIAGKLQLPLDAVAKGGKVRLGFAYRQRDYRHPTLSIGARRHEKRYTVTASADVPIGHGFILKPEYRGADRNSNYSFTDYTEDMASLSLVYRY